MADPARGAVPGLLAGLARPRVRLALAAGAGALAATGLAPFDLWFAALPALGFLIWLHGIVAGPRAAAWTLWAGGAGYFAVALHWIVEPFLVDVARHGWMAPFALILMAGGLALFWAVAGYVAAWIAKGGGRRALALALGLTLAEALRGTILTGFPWALVGHVLIASPLLSLGAWIGAVGLSLVVLMIAALLARAPASPLRAGGAAAVVLAGLIVTAPAFATKPPEVAENAPVLRLMQPNAPQHEKWDPRMIPVFLDRMIGFSAAQPAPDVTIWPETSVPAFLENAGGLFQAIAGQAQGAISVVGIERREGGDYLNSLAVLRPDGSVSDVYDKHHLVPFGEYLPAAGVLGNLGLGPLVNRFGGFAAGPGPRLVDLGRAGRALPLICYEAVFPRDVANAPERPDLLLQITNDAWFGTFSGPYQHLAQARLRAVEQGLPMVRVANTGVSAVIAADGTIKAQIPLGTHGYLDHPQPAAASPTLYARTGDWPVLAITLAGLVLLAIRRRRDS